MADGTTDSAPDPLAGRRVLLVEDDAMVARMVERALSRRGTSVTRCPDLDAAYAAIQETDGFDAAVVDLGLPDGNGFAAVGALRNHSPPCASVVVTGLLDGHAVRKCVECAAAELLAKPFDGASLADAVAVAVAQTRRWRHWYDAVGLTGDSGAPPSDPADSDRLVTTLVHRGGLTARERETLALLLRGAQNVEIAEHLGISNNTVKYHVRNLLRKLGFESRTELFRALVRKFEGD